MQVSFSLSNLLRFVRVNPAASGAATNILPPANATRQDITQQNLNDRRVGAITAALGRLDELLIRTEVRQRVDRAKAISGSALGLATDSTATRLDSDSEVNSQTTSYTPFGPEFAGSGLSTALPEISGAYDGSSGDDTLRFKVTREGVHGQQRIDVKVFDSDDVRLATLRIRDHHAIDREYAIGNGLIFTLGEGFLKKNDEFYLDVFASTPSSVDPDKPFDGTRDDRPNFDYGLSVGAGSFDINGVNIAVGSDDTIDAVLQRINGSAAGVDAVFDAAADRVRLTQRQAGSAHDIVLANDTSGFLAATKLTGSAQPGRDTEAEGLLAAASAFAAVTAGNLSINGNVVGFDPAVDSLTDVLARINAADIGVDARLVSGGQKVLIGSDVVGVPLALDDNGSGLFDALAIDERRYDARIRIGIPLARTYEIADQVEDSIALINEVFDPGANSMPLSASLADLRQRLTSALEENASQGATAFGISFRADARPGNGYVTVDRPVLTRQQRYNGGAASVRLTRLIGGLRAALSDYQSQPAPGTLLNTTA